MTQGNDYHVRIRCANGHERTIDFHDYANTGKPVQHVAFVRPALGELFPSYEGVWRDDGQLPRCPCGAGFVERVPNTPVRW